MIEVCDSLNSSMCVVRLSKMAASVYLFRAVERAKTPLGLKISASWSILRTLEMPKLWFDVICLFISLYKQLNFCTYVFQVSQR